MKNRIINVKGAEVTIATRHAQDYISLTDMLRRFGDESILYNWLRNRNTIEFLGIWEQLYNPAFKSIEFDRFKSQAGLNSFALSPKKWIEATDAIGLYAKAGRGGGTYAHKDIAFEFGSWLSPEFKLYLIKEFQRLKDEESRATSLGWSFQRTLAKVNYKIHTSAVLIAKARARHFARTFGYGKSLLLADCYEENFELCAVLNSVDPEKLRSVDVQSLDAVPLNRRSQASVATAISDFGLDMEQDLVYAATGQSKDRFFGKQLTGKDALKVAW